MAYKKITDSELATTMTDTDFYFIEQNGGLKKVQKSNVPKPTYNASEVGALPDTTTTLPNPHKFVIVQGVNRTNYDGSVEIELELATLQEAKQFLGI